MASDSKAIVTGGSAEDVADDLRLLATSTKVISPKLVKARFGSGGPAEVNVNALDWRLQSVQFDPDEREMVVYVANPEREGV